MFKPGASVVCVVPLRRGLPGVFPHIPPTFAQILWRDAGGFVAILDALRAFLPAMWMPNPSRGHCGLLCYCLGTWCALPGWLRHRPALDALGHRFPAVLGHPLGLMPPASPGWLRGQFLPRSGHSHGQKKCPRFRGLAFRCITIAGFALHRNANICRVAKS